MVDTIRVFSGRTISPEDIQLIKWARKTYPNLPWHELAGTVCELLSWNTASGNAKRIQCMECLGVLEAEGILNLPPVNTVMQRKGKIHIIARLNEARFRKSSCVFPSYRV